MKLRAPAVVVEDVRVPVLVVLAVKFLVKRLVKYPVTALIRLDTKLVVVALVAIKSVVVTLEKVGVSDRE